MHKFDIENIIQTFQIIIPSEKLMVQELEG